MSDFAPPSGPPPPKVPAGYKAVWNDQYSEWFYVNIYTKKSQWDKPTEPIYGPPDTHEPPHGPPPGHFGDKAHLASNNPYSGGSNVPDVSEDERLARQLQAEEDARARPGSSQARGESDSYYGGGAPSPYQAGPGHLGAGQGQQQGYGAPPSPQPQSYDAQQLPPRPEQKGFLGKLMGKGRTNAPPPQQQPGYASGYGQPGYGPPPQPGYGGYGGQGMYAGQPQYVQQQAPQRHHGLGTAGGAALGLGGGLLGGVLLGEALDNHDGGDGGDGGGDGGDGGGDYGGDGGGDFGGGDGGGDF